MAFAVLLQALIVPLYFGLTVNVSCFYRSKELQLEVLATVIPLESGYRSAGEVLARIRWQTPRESGR